MTNCFDNIVGLRGICEDKENLLYVNDVPGIRLAKFAATADDEQGTGKELFNRLHSEAVNQLQDDFISIMSETVQFSTVLDTRTIGDFEPEEEFHERQNLWLSREIYLNTHDPYVQLKVDYIEIKSRDALVKEIVIQDHFKSTVKTVKLQKGINRIPIDFKGDYVRISININDLHLWKVNACGYSGGYNTCKTCDLGYGCFIINNQWKENEFDNWKSSAIEPFVVCLSCICCKDNFVCKYKEELKNALRWKIAALLMEEIIFSDRKNPLVRNSKEEAERMLVKIMGGEDPKTGFEEKYPKYWKALNQTKKRIARSISTKSKCVHCSGRRIIETIP